jgi:integrase
MATSIKPPRALKTSLFARDPTGRSHFIHSTNLGTSVQQFEAVQTWLANEGIGLLNPSSLVLGCLLCFDGIATEGDLRRAYEACVQAARWGSAMRIDWLDGVRCDARELSVLTTLALQRVAVAEWLPFESAQSLFMRQVMETQFGKALANGSGSEWEQLLKHSAAWLQSILSPLYYGHVISVARLNALPRSAVAREQQKLAIALTEPSPNDEDARVTSSTYARAFEAALLGGPPSAFSGGFFIKKLTDALRAPTKGSNASERIHILDSLRRLASEIDQVDEVCALLYLFALDLVENGTRRKAQLAPTTPYDYVQGFAADFHTEAGGLHLAGIDVETYSKIFNKLLNTSNTAASYRAAGLKGFHLFLRAWWTVPRLPNDIFKMEKDSHVEANIVWPHEQKLVAEWLHQAEPTRFIRQLNAAMVIAGNAMLRISELLVLRLMNVIDEGDHLCIEIARQISDGKEKSSEGRRRVFIRDAQAVSTIRQWRARRFDENASPTDYLFGQPSDPRKVAEAGKMYFWMNRLLKSVTGDDTVSVHTLRHSIASQRFVSISLDDHEYEVNPLDELANEAGHIGGHVTTVNYCHLFEAGLRRSLDKGLRGMNLGYAMISGWTQCSEATLRQRVSRTNSDSLTREDILSRLLQSAADKVQCLAISQPIRLLPPQNPLQFLQSRPLSYRQVAGVLSDIASGQSISQSSSRQDLSESVINKIIKVVGSFADSHGEAELELLDELTLGSKALRDATGRLLGMRPDFSRMSQDHWSTLPKAIESGDQWMVKEATDYWRRTLCHEHIAVRPGPGWDQFVALIKEANINTSLMALKWSTTPSSETTVMNALALAQATIRLRLGSSLNQIPKDPRAGRPAIWLIISSDVKHIGRDGSGSSMTGLNCALLSAYVWLTVTETGIETIESEKS